MKSPKPYQFEPMDTLIASEPASPIYGAKNNTKSNQHQPTPYEMEVLRRSEEDIKAGRVYTQEEVDIMVKQWLD